MDETMNDILFSNTSTTDSATLTFTSDNTWFPYYQESTWLPYSCEKYMPKWHITQGYKNQIESMWD